MNPKNFLDGFQDKLTPRISGDLGALENHRFKNSILNFSSDTAWISVKLGVGLHICDTLHYMQSFSINIFLSVLNLIALISH